MSDSRRNANDSRGADHVRDPARLAALRRAELLDTLPEDRFDRLTRLAANLLDVPAAFISLVDEHRDFYLSHYGFGEPLATTRQITGRTFCHYAIASEGPLVIPDTRADPVYRRVPTVESLGVAAYLGVPLRISSGEALGSLCAIDTKPRAWTQREIQILSDLAASVVTEIELRMSRAELERRVEERTRELSWSEARFRAMVEHGHDIITLTDAKGVIRYDSPSIERVLGYTREERVGGGILDLVHPEDQPHVLAVLAEAREHPGRVFSLELRVRHKNGSWRWLESTGRDALHEPAIAGGVISSRDITERKAVEEDRERTLSLLDATLESTADGILVVDTQGRIRNYNQRFQQLWRIPDELIRTQSGDALIAHAADQLEDPEAFFAHAKALHADPEGRHFDVLVFKDGRVFERYSQPQRIGEEAVGRVFSYRDVTKQRRAEERERELVREHTAREQTEKAQERIRNILESITDAFFALDENWCFTYVNREAEALLDRSRDKLLGRNLWELYPDSAERAFYAQYHRAVEEQVAVEFEEYSPRPDRWLRVRAYPYEEGLTVYLRDITDRKEAEEAVRETEEHYRIVAQTTHDAIWELDPTRNQIQWTPTFAAVFGGEARNVEEWAERIHPEDRERVASGFEHALESRANEWSDEYRFRREDGTYAHVFDRAACEYDEQNRPVRIVGALMDISARRQAEAALRESERQHRLLFEGNPLPMMVFDPGTLRFLSLNEAAVRHYGYSREEFLSMTIRDLRAEEDLPQLEQLLQRGLEDGQTDAVRHWTKDGRVIHALVTGSTVPFRGEPARLVVVHDVTERVRVEEALHESQLTMQSILAASPDVVKMLDSEGQFRWVSPAIQDALGYEPDQVQGQPMQDLMAAEDHERFEAALHRLVDGSTEEVRLRYLAQHRDGRWVPFEARGRAIRNEVLRGLVLVARDVTEQEQLIEGLRAAKEVAEAASRAKSEMLSRTSHELRTPLNAILGFGQLLELEVEREENRESVEQILRAGRHLLNLIDEVLDIARAESGQMTLPSEPVDVKEVVEQVLSLLRPLAGQRKVELPPSALPMCDMRVHADPQRLRQVLLNLGSNAIKYNRVGGRVDVACEEVEGERVRIGVRDTGPGIPPERLSRLFRPFDRLDAEKSGMGAVEGTGLGLALSKALTEAMHGSIGAQSTLGEGSTFWIELPRAPEQPQQLTETEGPGGTMPETAASVPVVLYVDDEPANVRLIERIFRRSRPEVDLITATGGREGLELAKERRPDLILLDLNLPDISGEGVLAALRDEASTRELPVVMLSGDANPEQVKRLRNLGVVDYLTKPVQVPHLLETVAGVLDRGGMK